MVEVGLVSARYGAFSVYAPEPQPWLRPLSCTHVAPDGCRRCEGDYPTIGPGWDPYEVLARCDEDRTANAKEGAA